MSNQQGNRWPTRWGAIAPLVVILTLVVILGLPGCSDEPLNVNTSQEDVDFFDLPFDEEVLSKGGLTYLDVGVASQYLEVDEGGTIEVHGNNGEFRFVVPPFSFTTNTLFTVAVYVIEDDDARVSIIYEFSPDGLVFSEPAWLVLDADVVAGVDGDSIDFYYLDGKRWKLQGTYRANKDGEIWVDINHFSRYGSG